jgi:hypothetical protein
MQTKLAKFEAIIPTLATREDLARKTTETMDRIDRLVAELRTDLDRKFILCMSIQITTLFAIAGLLSKITDFF